MQTSSSKQKLIQKVDKSNKSKKQPASSRVHTPFDKTPATALTDNKTPTTAFTGKIEKSGQLPTTQMKDRLKESTISLADKSIPLTQLKPNEEKLVFNPNEEDPLFVHSADQAADQASEQPAKNDSSFHKQYQSGSKKSNASVKKGEKNGQGN